MGFPQAKSSVYTVDDYLRFERDAVEKHEYRDGEIVAMAGASYEHAVIVSNMMRALGNRLEGKPCRPLGSDLRVRVPRRPLYFYPDVSVICGSPQFDPQDAGRQTVTNPRLVIEVLSPSTQLYDRGEKFDRYREIESLQEYVLVQQDVARVEVFFRRDDGAWMFMPAVGMGAVVLLRSLGIELPLAEVYAGVTLPPAEGIQAAETKRVKE